MEPMLKDNTCNVVTLHAKFLDAYLKCMRKPAEDITLPLFIANDMGALKMAADVLLQC